MVFLESLKDTRPTAPNMSYGSRAGQIWPIAQKVLIRETQPDIARRCDRVLLRVRNWPTGDAEENPSLARYRNHTCVVTAGSRDFSAQET